MNLLHFVDKRHFFPFSFLSHTGSTGENLIHAVPCSAGVSEGRAS